MAASAWRLYNSAKEYIGDGTIDLDGHTFMIILCLSTSNAATLTLTNYGEITNEVATNYGYTQGDKALTSVTWTNVTGTVTFDAADAIWAASGGSIVARFAVIYDDDAASDELLCYCLLDTTPADITATTGNNFQISMPANGIFRVSGGTA